MARAGFTDVVATHDSIAAQLRALADGRSWCDFDDLTVFRAAGETARETLQRVVSQDVGSFTEGRAALALVLSAKGQCRALMAVLAVAGGLRVVAPPGCGERLRKELEKFLLLSRCRLEEATRSAVAVIGSRWPDGLMALGIDPSLVMNGGVATGGSGPEQVVAFPGTLVGVDGAVVAAGESVLSDFRRRLVDAGVPLVSQEVIELERIRRGFPAWTTEISGNYLPHEIGLDHLAVSTRKGCYIGQETMARLETYGHPNRVLVGIREIDGGGDAPPLPADLTPEGEERPRGSLTAWARHPEIGGVGLAVVRRQYAEPGTCLRVGGRAFTVAAVPLW